MSHEAHKRQADKTVNCAVITVSDTRTEATDKSGRLIQDLLAREGHEVGDYRIVKDEPDAIEGLIRNFADQGGCHAVLLSGGTGLAPRDTTHEAVDRLLEKRLTGFGELFRVLSYEQIGSAAMASRAVAGTYRGVLIFSMPGSSGAVNLAMEKLILPELAHLVWVMRT